MTGWRARSCRRMRRWTATRCSPPPPGARPLAGDHDLTELGHAATITLARAVARGVYEATALPCPGAQPSWRDRFGAPGAG